MYGAPRITQCLCFLYNHNARGFLALSMLDSKFTPTGATEAVARISTCSTLLAVCRLTTRLRFLIATA